MGFETGKLERLVQVLVLNLLLPLAFTLSAGPPNVDDMARNDNAITPARLKAHLEFIASDELEGRDTPSKGLDIATLYVASQLKLWGAKPAGDNGSFFQRVPVRQRRIDQEKSSIQVSGKSFVYGTGFRAANKACTLRANMVYAGHGYILKAKKINPYAGLDVRGKIVVIADSLPKGISFEDLTGKEGEDYMGPALAAQKLGAVAVLKIPGSEYLEWNGSSDLIGGVEVDVRDTPIPGLPSLIADPTLVQTIFDGESVRAEDVLQVENASENGFAFSKGKSMRIDIVVRKEMFYPRNVVAIIPGTDPKLKEEYVAYGAHIDHIGIRTGESKDQINNGADDDGSGTVALLEIAHALLTGPRPKRSSLFVWHIGEEKDLWGSGYYTSYPTVNLKKIVAQLNIDMIGRSKKKGDKNPANKVLTGPDEIYVVGSTKMSTDLQKTSERTNASFLKLKFNYKYDDPNDPEGIFYRSDHYNYARQGIPIIFYFDGVHQDYHQPGDEVSKIDFVKMSKVTRTVLATGWSIANAPKRPVVDKPLKP